MVLFTTFVNGRLCRDGELVEDQLVISQETGTILKKAGYIGGDIVDLEDKIVAPGFIDIQTNGMLGFHFTHFETNEKYYSELVKAARYLPSTGVTGFLPTIPTVDKALYEKVLPCLSPQEIPDGASVLGAHVEGPYLHPSKKGAHNETLFQAPAARSPVEIYGASNLKEVIKLITLAPELPGTMDVISALVSEYPCQISLGHSSATFEEGKEACERGARCLTHLFNAMNPLHHRTPGLPGLTSLGSESPFYSLIADNIHVHPAVYTMAFRANPRKAILITDSIEMAGLPDGTYPGHAQIPHEQVKQGNEVVIKGTNTLIGSCCGLDECVRNLFRESGCSLAEAVRCVTENVADLLRSTDRGKLEEGRRADFVIMDDEGLVLETWIAGRRVWIRE